MTRLTFRLACLLAVLALTACGNKGDLYLLPDELGQQEFEQLQRTLGGDDMPLAEPVEVSDQLVHDTDETTETDERKRSNTAPQPADN